MQINDLTVMCGHTRRQRDMNTVCFYCRISDSHCTPPTLPFFLFGDFNFRLDTQSLVQVHLNIFLTFEGFAAAVLTSNPLLMSRRQHLSTSAEAQTVKKSSSDEVERLIWEEKDNDHQVSRTGLGRTWPSRLCLCRSLIFPHPT